MTWQNVHLGDDPHVLVVEQNYRGERKRLKTDASIGRVPISSGMASLLAAVRPVEAPQTAPVFPSKTGTPLLAQNVRNRVLLPALEGGRTRRSGDRLPCVQEGVRVAAARAGKDAQAGPGMAAALEALDDVGRLHPPDRQRLG